MTRYEHLADLAALVGREIGVSDWITIEQSRIDAFAEATDFDDRGHASDGPLIGCGIANEIDVNDEVDCLRNETPHGELGQIRV